MDEGHERLADDAVVAAGFNRQARTGKALPRDSHLSWVTETSLRLECSHPSAGARTPALAVGAPEAAGTQR